MISRRTQRTLAQAFPVPPCKNVYQHRDYQAVVRELRAELDRLRREVGDEK